MDRIETNKKRQKTQDAKQPRQYTFFSYSSTRVTRPKENIQKELVIQNENGKMSGSYSEKKNGKQVVKKEFKSLRTFDALKKQLVENKNIRVG
jgi:hypothetical protein